MKINIGCGRDYREGWLNTDVSLVVKADAYFDIGKDQIVVDKEGYYAQDGEADHIYISGVLEQIGDNDRFLHAMNEIWRVLKHDGILEIIVPNAKFAIAHRDPMDIRKFTPDTFRYFIEGNQEYRDYGSVYGFKPWRSLTLVENARHIMIIKMLK